MRGFPLVDRDPVLSPSERPHPTTVVLASRCRAPLPVRHAPRGIPRLGVALIHQTPRSRNTRVRGKIDVPGHAREVNAVQLDRVDQVFQNARIAGQPVDVDPGQRVGLATPQCRHGGFPVRTHHPVSVRAVRQHDPPPLERGHVRFRHLALNAPADPGNELPQVAELIVDLLVALRACLPRLAGQQHPNQLVRVALDQRPAPLTTWLRNTHGIQCALEHPQLPRRSTGANGDPQPATIPLRYRKKRIGLGHRAGAALDWNGH